MAEITASPLDSCLQQLKDPRYAGSAPCLPLAGKRSRQHAQGQMFAHNHPLRGSPPPKARTQVRRHGFRGLSQVNYRYRMLWSSMDGGCVPKGMCLLLAWRAFGVFVTLGPGL